MTDYERIRSAYFRESKSQRQICREFGHSRKTVRKAIRNSTPEPYRRTKEVRPVLTAEFQDKINAIIKADENVHRKQRHTAMRLYERLCDEHGFTGSYATVNRYAGPQLAKREVFMDLVFETAEELQIDWGQATVMLDGVKTIIHLFCARCCSSKASFVRAYQREDQLSFLDGHDHAMALFGGLHGRYCYDNLATAVISRPKKKTKCDEGTNRVLTEPFRKMRSHYLMFGMRFCSPGRGNEKGHVENLVKYAQRSLLCPLPNCKDMAILNECLLTRCVDDLGKAMGDTTRGALLEQCRRVFTPLPPPYHPSKSESTIANRFSCVRYENCTYSVPTAHAHQPCVVTCYASEVEISSGNRVVAKHARALPGDTHKLDFRHYLPHLERKKGWLANGRAFQPDNLPVALRRFRASLLERYGDEGLERLVKVLMLYQDYSAEQVDCAIARCLERELIHEGAVVQELNNPGVVREDVSLAFDADSPLNVPASSGRSAAEYDVLLKEAS